VLQCVAVCCSVLQCVAVCCSVLQCVAVCCSVRCGCAVQQAGTTVPHCNTLQDDAIHCTTWQAARHCGFSVTRCFCFWVYLAKTDSKQQPWWPSLGSSTHTPVSKQFPPPSLPPPHTLEHTAPHGKRQDFATTLEHQLRTATHCDTLQHTAHTVTHHNIWQAMRPQKGQQRCAKDTAIPLQQRIHTATHYNALQHMASDQTITWKGSATMHTMWSEDTATPLKKHIATATHYYTLQRTITHCNTLHATKQHKLQLGCTEYEVKTSNITETTNSNCNTL